MHRYTNTILVIAAFTLISTQAFAQAAEQPSLDSRTGTDVNVTVSGYNYTEPGAQNISIHGLKIGGEFSGILSISPRRRWFFQSNVRGVVGNATYDGWCSPFVISPSSGSANGYALHLGEPSPCSETKDKDWYVEARGLIGKDLVTKRWGFSPYTGLGLRHLSNGTSGVAGYRTDDYLYLPLGVTTRTGVAASRTLSLTLEADALLHGWQTTRDSQLGGGDVPATPFAPAFTINGFTDVSFSQSRGWGLRASGRYELTRHWSFEPYYIRWTVESSPVNYETATYTVRRITATEQLGAYEPLNHTNEVGVKWGFHF